MPILTLRLPDVNLSPSTRPAACPTCGWKRLMRWGTFTKRVRDPQLHNVTVFRYRCCRCQRSFRVYPHGVDRATQTRRLRHLAAITWALGLSLRSVVTVFDACGLALSRMSVWRDGQAFVEHVRAQRHTRPVRVLGLDGTGTRIQGQPTGLVVAVDLGNGVPVGVAELDEKDPQAVIAWLGPLVTQLGVEVIVTDDLGSYRRVAEELGLYQQVCLWHGWRWVGRALTDLRAQLPAWTVVIEEVWLLVRTLPPDGAQRLLQLWAQLPAEGAAFRQKPALDRLRQIIWHLHHGWQTYRLALEQPDVPRTNNGTEQAIGRFKSRSKHGRGHKTWTGVARTMLLSSGMRS
jgi:transposase-like protein/DNA-directed RNA polymerase subunit RPC12/RpoP